MFILDSLLVGGLRFVFDKIAAAVDTELTDDSALREQLLEAQMRFELGELTEADIAEIETDLLARIREIREQRQGPALSPTEYKVTGVEATFASDESER